MSDLAQPRSRWPYLLFGLALLVGFWLRFSGLEWDGDEHLHPDERFLTMVTSSLAAPADLLGYLDTDTSMLNPRNAGHAFYVYGTWPITLAYAVASAAEATDYYRVHLVGRNLNMLYDWLGLILIFLIGRRLVDARVGALAALLAAGTAFSIQQAHFFTVDVPANFFFLCFLYAFLRSLEGRFSEAEAGRPAAESVRRGRRLLWTALAGVGMGMALASKIALWPVAPLAVLVLGLLAWRTVGWPLDRSRAVLPTLVLGLVSFLTLRFCQPDMFAGPGWPNVQENAGRYAEVTAKAPHWWWRLEGRSAEMGGELGGSGRGLLPGFLKPYLLPDPRWAGNLSEIGRQIQGYGMDWPPNHQWFGRRDWLFPARNMVLWGMGLPLGLAGWLAWLWAARELWLRRRLALLLPWLWTALVFGYYGQQWGKTMRYFLPVYPTLTLLAAAGLVALVDARRRQPPPDAEDPAGDAASRLAGEPMAEAAGEVPDVVGRAAEPAVDESAVQPPKQLATGVVEPPAEHRSPQPWPAIAVIVLVAGGTLLWGFMFSRIYATDHSRIQASRWIYHRVPTAFGLTIDTEADASGRGDYLPARAPASLRFTPQTYRYQAADGAWLGPMEVLVPGGKDVTVNGAHLSHAISADGGPAGIALEAVLTDSDSPGPDGGPQQPLVRGEGRFQLSDIEQQLVVNFDKALVLKAAPEPERELQGLARLLLARKAPEPAVVQRYQLWLRPRGAALAGRTSIFAHDTSWDDTVPRGIEGYAPWDQAETDYAEGLFGFVQLQMYDEDKEPAKLDRLIQGLTDADYFISTSNRVYGSTRQLPTRYPWTNRFYDHLFAERFGVEHTASIHSVPRLGSLEVNDQGAEEAFHVYDHPQVDVWATKDIDLTALRGDLTPYIKEYSWTWPSGSRSFAERYLPFLPKGGAGGRDASNGLDATGEGAGRGTGRSLVGRLLGLFLGTSPADAGTSLPNPEGEAALAREKLLLSPERVAEEEAGADYLFAVDSAYTRQPVLAALAWYLLLTLIGLLAWPLAATCLPNLMDKGWAVARIGGLLLVSWAAWLVASLGYAPHQPPLLWACVTALGVAAWLLPGRRRARARLAWLRENRALILSAELLFLTLFLIFLGIRIGNPDLWHPWYGGEKPMDFAYLNATLRSVSFPPFDPWFAGGKLNYYYFGFVVVGSLFELSRVPPWIGYNLAIPSLAAMTGLGCAGIAYTWARALGVGAVRARVGGGLAALMAVLMGNLYQVPFILGKAAALVGPVLGDPAAADPGLGAGFQSRIPGLALLVNGLRGLGLVFSNGLDSLGVSTGHWYWNASRAIPEQGETVAITEMPFFTFVYADLHAHMMALPLTVLALACALSWALPTRAEDEGWWWLEAWGLGRLALAGLAIGSLWPANTWDFPSYGLVAAGAIGAGMWQRLRGPSWAWFWAVLWRGLLLLGLSRIFFLPYHQNYVTPYADFDFWTGTKTPLAAFLTVHGIFLAAILAWALWRLDEALASRAERVTVLRTLLLSAVLSGLTFYWLWQKTVTGDGNQGTYPPSPWTALLGALLLALGLTLLLRPRQAAAERLAAWVLLLGAFLSQFVEYGVLAGDIARMNTVFKFYIQIWVLWAVLAAVAYAWLSQRVDERRAAGWTLPATWRLACQLLIACGLVYTVTAARGKIADRFPAYGAEAEAKVHPGLDGMAYMDWAQYEDGGNLRPELSRQIPLAHDRDAMRWLLANVKGSPVILEAFHYMGGYRWGSRFSIYTGLPTVIGWDWHQTQQRNAGGRGVIEQRMQDVQAIYNGTSLDEALDLLTKYQVRYLIVGELERSLYEPAGIAKFQGLVQRGAAELVYESPAEMRDSQSGEPAVRIYRLKPARGAEGPVPEGGDA